MGEVNKPATVLPMRNGKLSLGEAISQAGSINHGTADAKELYVIRGGPGIKPQVYHLDATSPVCHAACEPVRAASRRTWCMSTPAVSCALTGC